MVQKNKNASLSMAYRTFSKTSQENFLRVVLHVRVKLLEGLTDKFSVPQLTSHKISCVHPKVRAKQNVTICQRE